MSCYNCGRTGHIARYCKKQENAHYMCERSHTSRDCEHYYRKCYRCGKIGHIFRDCPEPDKGDRKCYNCGAEGHISTDCPEFGSYTETPDTVCYRTYSMKTTTFNQSTCIHPIRTVAPSGGIFYYKNRLYSASYRNERGSLNSDCFYKIHKEVCEEEDNQSNESMKLSEEVSSRDKKLKSENKSTTYLNESMKILKEDSNHDNKRKSINKSATCVAGKSLKSDRKSKSKRESKSYKMKKRKKEEFVKNGKNYPDISPDTLILHIDKEEALSILFGDLAEKS